MRAGGVRSRPGGRAVAGSVILHVLIAAAVVVPGYARRTASPQFQVYRVNIVSPPPRAQGDPTPATPAQQTRVVRPEPAQPPKAEPKRPEPRRPQPAKTPAADPPKADTVSRGQRPNPRSPGGDGLNVRLEGVTCPSPEYCDNIIRQIYRHFRWSGPPGLYAQVYFVIRRDGSVEDLRILRESGNPAFDLEAMGAIEAAGNSKAFGPIPKEFRADRLPIQFDFYPPR